MSEIGFYHLTRSKLDTALPALLARVLAQPGARAVIRAADEQAVAKLDDLLWQISDPPWLPHGTAKSGNADLQPIWITHNDDAPNGAKYLFLIGNTECATPEKFDRIFDLFNGADGQAVNQARTRFAAARAGGHVVTYWKQGPKGWEKN